MTDIETWTLLTFTNKSEVGMYDIAFFFLTNIVKLLIFSTDITQFQYILGLCQANKTISKTIHHNSQTV